MKEQLADLTPREQRILAAIIRERDAYKALRHGIAARILNGTIWVQLLVIRRIDTGPDTEPASLAPMVRSTDSLEFLVRAIGKLPDPHRQAMRLQVLAHKSADEIAAELRMPVAETEHLLGEAAVKLRAILATVAERRKG